MRDDRFEKGEVGRNTADAELAQCAIHPLDGFLGRRRPGGHLLEQRIVEAGDHRARIGGAAIKANAEAGRTAIGSDTAIIRNEVLFRVFGGDPALQRMTVELDVVLRRHARFRCSDCEAIENVDLRLDDVDPGDFLGHRVLDLDARIDLDEIELSGIGIHQEFDRARTDIVGRIGDLQRVAGQFRALFGVQIRRRRALDDFLVAALDRAVALEEMHGVAVGIAQNLHLDMAGTFDELFEIDFVLAEGSLRLALGFGHFAGELILRADGAHAATTTAPGRFQHDWIADLVRKTLDLLHVVGQRLGGRNHGNADLDGEIARCHLVAEPAHGLRLGTDENDAVLGTGISKFGAFGE